VHVSLKYARIDLPPVLIESKTGKNDFITAKEGHPDRVPLFLLAYNLPVTCQPRRGGLFFTYATCMYI
jgi:hypothetical protein